MMYRLRAAFSFRTRDNGLCKSLLIPTVEYPFADNKKGTEKETVLITDQKRSVKWRVIRALWVVFGIATD